jgi:hypothetical protein
MKNLFILLFIISNFNIFAQADSLKNTQREAYKKNIDSKKGTWSFGINEQNYRIINGFADPVQKLFFPVVGLKVGYNPSNRVTMGLEYTHQFIWGTNLPKTLHYNYGSAFARYDVWRRKNAFYIETNYMVSDVAWLATGWEKRTTSYAGIGYGLKAKMYPNVYFTYNHNFNFPLSNGTNSMLIDRRIGITYCFNPKVNDTPLSISNSAKDRTGKMVIGISAAFMPFDEYDFTGGYNIYESTVRLGYYQSSFLNFGLYGRFTIGDSGLPNYPTDLFYFTGPYVNAKLNALKRWNYFIELAYLTSNFTLLGGGGSLDPPQKGKSSYFSTTLGPSYRINNNISIELGINISNVIKSNTGGFYSAGGYRLGIEKTFKWKHRATLKSF